MLVPFFRGDDKPIKGGVSGSIEITKVRLSVPTVTPGQRKFVQVFFKRIDYKGPVKVSLKNLPAYIDAKPTIIPEKKSEGEIAFWVSADPDLNPPLTSTVRVILESVPEGIAPSPPLKCGSSQIL